MHKFYLSFIVLAVFAVFLAFSFCLPELSEAQSNGGNFTQRNAYVAPYSNGNKTTTQKITGERILPELLDLPAPPPRKPSDKPKIKTVERKPEFFDSKKPPADDAPIADLLDYWERLNGTVSGSRYFRDSTLRPSSVAINRILDALPETPERIANFLALFVDNPAAVAMVRQQYDAEIQAEKLEVGWRERIGGWLKLNSDLQIDKLFEKARLAADARGNTSSEEELFALARVDWDRAKPFLQQLERDTSQPITAISAMWAMYRRAIRDKDEAETTRLRDKLKSIVENSSNAAGLRDKAMDALVLSESWAERDDWYLSLLGDETLFALKSENGYYTGLTTLVGHEDADKWIPIMARLVSNNNPTIRNAAVRNLMQMRAGNRADALEPLVPWLSDANWAKELQGERKNFINALKDVDVPAAIPGLIAVIQTEEGEFQTAAALALSRYKDARIVAVLKAALEKENGAGNQEFYIGAILKAGGFTDAEQAAALEIFAFTNANWQAVILKRQQALARGESSSPDEMWDATFNIHSAKHPLDFKIGRYLSQQSEPPADGVLSLVFDRIRFLETTDATAANNLREIVQRWQHKLIDIDFLQQISTGKADLEMILTVLARREELRERVAGELNAMRVKTGIARAAAAAALEDNLELLAIVNGNDTAAKIAALGFARLLRLPLPVENVAEYLTDKNKLLALAAERYLESEDSPAAQNALLAQHKGEALILGATDSFNPKRQTVGGYGTVLGEIFLSLNASPVLTFNSAIENFEEKLRLELKENSDLLEIYAFLPAQENAQSVIRVFKDRAVYRFYEDAARYRERNLTDKEFEVLRNNIAAAQLETLPPLDEKCERQGCRNWEFLAVNRSRGRRVFVQISESFPEPIDKIYNIFKGIEESNTLRLRYKLQDKIENLEVLLADDDYPVRDVWQGDGEIRALVVDTAKAEADAEALGKLEEIEDKTAADKGEDEYGEAWQKRQEIKEKRREGLLFLAYLWRTVREGKLAELTTQPAESPFIPAPNEVLPNESNDRRAWQTRVGNYEIHHDYSDEGKGGLFKMSRSGEPILFKEGNYDEPIVSPDQKWLVTTKSVLEEKDGRNFYREFLVRINLANGKETAVNSPPNSDIEPLAFVPAHNKFLIQAMQNRASTNYFLLDAATGATSPVKGEFRPLARQTHRPLQPSSQPNVFWAAILDEKTNSTEIGLYDAKTFAFKSLLKIPEIQFDSMNLWVDESAAKAYFVYEGHLLALALPQTAKP